MWPPTVTSALPIRKQRAIGAATKAAEAKRPQGAAARAWSASVRRGLAYAIKAEVSLRPRQYPRRDSMLPLSAGFCVSIKSVSVAA